VGALATSEVIVNYDAAHVRIEEFLYDVTTDESRAPDNKNCFASDVHTTPL
jgi:hypothetical protein